MAYTPATGDTTKISGAVIVVASSATALQLVAGRAYEITGSAAQTTIAPVSPVNGAEFSLKVAESYTGPGVTMPTGLAQANPVLAGQAYTWQFDGTGYNIQ